jgi:hypothetical protein
VQTLLAILVAPLGLLNVFGDVVSGVWLAILGEWWAIGYGFAALATSTYLLSFAMMPGLLFASPGVALVERGRTLLALPFLFLNELYTCAVISIWCLFAFVLFMSRATHSSFWPLLIWSHGVAVGPWQYLAYQDARGGNEFSAFTAILAQVAYVVMALALILGVATTTIQLGTIFVAIMIVGSLFMTGFAYLETHAQAPERAI